MSFNMIINTLKLLQSHDNFILTKKFHKYVDDKILKIIN